MTDKTTQDLVYRAMSEIGRLYDGAAPSDADYDAVFNLVEPMIEQINAEEIAYIDDANAIAPKWFLPLARLLGIEAAPSFGTDAIQNLLTNSRAANVDALRDREYATLRRLSASGQPVNVLQPDYF